MDKNPFTGDWMAGWQNLQRKMWEDWSDVTQSSWTNAWQNENPMNFFKDGMAGWQKMFAMPQATPEVMAMRHAMGSMEEFMRMGREVFKMFQNMSEGTNLSQEWTSQLDKTIQQAKAMFSQGQESFQGVMGQWGKLDGMNAMMSNPMKAWVEFLNTNPIFANDTMRALLTGGQASEEAMMRFLSAPGVGYNRERQEKMQEGMRLVLEFRKAFEEFQTLMNETSKKALDKLHKKLLEMGAEGKQLQSMRDLYVLWVDCNEEANAATVTTKEFNELNSRMMNALMRVRRNVAETMDNAMGAVNLPTRRELDSAHRQIASLRRRLSALEDALQELKGKDSSAEIHALRDDMEKLGVRRLRDELADLKRQLEESSSAPTLSVVESSGTEPTSDKSAIKKTVRIGNAKPALVAAPAQKGE
ncbi:Poly(3-hydroxyalkanoate) polymerase subunit PhaE [Candidatus Magnetaquicoccaceae bacterium FCR-1]|uniref:Poly(3-hydroxyalkanoate) polymerase subunit PhaE n=1 Tax=Candidatus Magnetaquiglobus chichijimensis TaxID=3141448 RepID=A0ABQ0CCB3_9PROT